MRSEFRLFLLVSLGLQQAVSQRSIWIGEEPEVRDECAPDSPYRIQIREGDCLSMLAEASSTSVDRWMTFNPRIADNNWLDVGWNLCAPAGASPIRNLKKCGPAPPETILQLKTTTQPFQPVPFAFRTTISPNRNHDETTLTEVIGGIIQCIFLANHIAECQDECSEETSIVYLTPLVKMEKRACHGKTSVSHNWDFSDGIISASGLNSPTEQNARAVAACLFRANTSDYECSGISVCQAVRTAQYYDCTYAPWWRGMLLTGNPLQARDRLVGKSEGES